MKKTYVAIIFILVILSNTLLSGCFSRDSDDPYTEPRSIIHDDITRSYRVHIPPDVDDFSALVFVLHGGGGNAENMEEKQTKKGFNLLSDQEGFIVVYPDGIEHRWNDGRTKLTDNESFYDIDDVGFLTLLIETLSDEFNIPDNNVFFTGISNGGFMSYRMGFETPDKIKAIFPVCATNALDLLANYSAHGPVSIAIMCGTDDPLVPYNGGYITIFNQTRSMITSVNDTVDFWIELNQCSKESTVYEYPDINPSDGTRVVRESYQNGINDTVVYLYTVLGGGHTWPGGIQYLPVNLIGRTCRDIDANTEIWNFFNERIG